MQHFPTLLLFSFLVTFFTGYQRSSRSWQATFTSCSQCFKHAKTLCSWPLLNMDNNKLHFLSTLLELCRRGTSHIVFSFSISVNQPFWFSKVNTFFICFLNQNRSLHSTTKPWACIILSGQWHLLLRVQFAFFFTHTHNTRCIHTSAFWWHGLVRDNTAVLGEGKRELSVFNGQQIIDNSSVLAVGKHKQENAEQQERLEE